MEEERMQDKTEEPITINPSQQIQSEEHINQIQYKIHVNGVQNEQKEIEVDASQNQKLVEQIASEQYWQSKKNSFIEEMSKLLMKGIDQSEQLLYEMDAEILNQKIRDAMDIISDSSKSDQRVDIEKKLIKESCIWLIEGKNSAEYDLIKLSTIIKEYAEKILSSIPSILEKNLDYYRDIIAETAEKKTYGLKLTKDISILLLNHQNSILDQATDLHGQSTQLKIGLHDVWEIKEVQSLLNNTKIEEIDFIRKKCRFHSTLLKGLEKLIKAIDKGKGEDEAFSSYKKIVMNPPKMKVQNKTNIKGSAQKAVMEKTIEESLKKTKTDNIPTTPTKDENQNITEEIIQEIKQIKKSQKKPSNKKIKSGENKNEMNEEVQQQPAQLEQDITNKINCDNPINAEQIKQTSAKKNQNESKKNHSSQTTTNITKDNNQKNLFSFFKKNNNSNLKTQQNQDFQTQIQQEQASTDNPENMNVIIQHDTDLKQNQQNKEDGNQKNIKSIFRKIGSADPRPQSLQTTESIRNVTQNEQVFSILQQQCRQQWDLLKKMGKKQIVYNSQMIGKNQGKISEKQVKMGKRRRILVLIHDYVRQYKSSYFDQKSNIINPRNFLVRDDDLIQYDMDTEDELQELNAENIENEDDEVDEEELEDDDSAKQFIVPDGYLSDEGFDSDKEDIFDQKKLNFQNYNFSENTNKQGFIFQEKDKAGDVQNFLVNYRAKKYEEQETFPLCLKKKQNKNQDEQGQIVAPIVWTNERQKLFIRSVHGSYLPKKALLEQISKIEVMKDISRNRLEKKFKEIIQKDDKQDGEAIKRWLVHSAVINSLDFQENEMEDLKKQRQEEYKSSRQSKKDEKIVSQNQSVISSQNSQNNNNIKQQDASQNQMKQFIGVNVLPVQTPQKKSITPKKPIIINLEEEEDILILQQIEEQNIKQQQEQIKRIQEQIEVKDNNQQIKHQSDENKNHQLRTEMIDENSFNQLSCSFEQKNKSRKNSYSMNENSNTSAKKSSMKQQTLNFLIKKS